MTALQITGQRTVIRPSSLSSWPDCPRRGAAGAYAREIVAAGWVLRVLPHNVAASVGTATHTATAVMLEEKMAGRYGLGTVSAAEQAGVEAFDEIVREGLTWDATSPNADTAEKQIVRMARTYATHLVPVIEPIAVEERLEVDAGDGFILSGQSDAMAREPGRVRDTKTGTISRVHSGQLGAYAIIQHSHGRDVRGATVDFIQRVSVKKDQPPPVVSEYGIDEIVAVAASRIERVKAEVTEFRRRLETGDAPPEFAFDSNPMSMLCSEKFCPAFGTKWCAEWQYKEKKDE